MLTPVPPAADARRARSARALKVGTLRPAIVLYDEPHPLGDDIGAIQSMDITRKPDMLIIMGTSLKVHGFKKLVKEFARSVHKSAPPPCSPGKSPKGAKSYAGKVIFVNKTAPGSEWEGIVDYHVAGETDKWCERVIEDWKKMRPADWEVQKTLDAPEGFKVVKDITNAATIKPKCKSLELGILTDEKLMTTFSASKNENRPPIDGETSRPPVSIDTTLSPPPSPKRRKSDCHYSAGESSPSKKRASRELELVDFEGRGLLFGDATNMPSKDGQDDTDDVFASSKPVDASTAQPKPRPRSRSTGAHPRTRSRVEVVVESRTGRTLRRAASAKTVTIR